MDRIETFRSESKKKGLRKKSITKSRKFKRWVLKVICTLSCPRS